MKTLQTFPETYNYIILGIVYLSIIFKALHDAYHYKYDKESRLAALKDKKALEHYGEAYHIFGFAAVIIPFFITLVVKMNYMQFFASALGYIAVYAFLMSFLFNIFAGKNMLYIGNTDITDKWLRENFMIYDTGTPEYENLSAKGIQRMNFRKFIIFFVRFVVFIVGSAIFIDLI